MTEPMTTREAEAITEKIMDGLIAQGIRDEDQLAELAHQEIEKNHPKVLEAMALARLEQEIRQVLDEEVAKGKLLKGPHDTYYKV